MKSTRLLFFIFLILAAPPKFVFALDTAYSGNYVIPENQSGYYESQYEVKVGQKLERGAENFLMGFLEVPHGVKTELRDREAEYLDPGVETVFLGATQGFFKGIGRTAIGFYEMVTCLFPQPPILPEMREWLY